MILALTSLKDASVEVILGERLDLGSIEGGRGITNMITGRKTVRTAKGRDIEADLLVSRPWLLIIYMLTHPDIGRFFALDKSQTRRSYKRLTRRPSIQKIHWLGCYGQCNSPPFHQRCHEPRTPRNMQRRQRKKKQHYTQIFLLLAMPQTHSGPYPQAITLTTRFVVCLGRFLGLLR